MKSICAFLLFAASVPAADFATGQAARLVIGQSTFTAQDPASSGAILGAVSGLAYAGNTLFVADSNRAGAEPNNHRVLIYRNLSDIVPAPTAELPQVGKCPACIGTASIVLGQPDFKTVELQLTPSNRNLRLPTSIATDGVRLAVADTDHNRVLIWNTIPTSNYTPADVVLGQPNFTSVSVPVNGVPSASSLRGPQGVWFQNGKLYVADTQNDRILIWNSIPATNGAPASVVLGQPNFTTFVQVDISQQETNAGPSNMLNPVSVTSDGQRLFVSDLGFNRVLVWNTIPTTNAAPADFAIGQPGLNTSISNYGFKQDANGVQTPVLCTVSNGTDENGHPTYPQQCNATLSFPRYALAAGNRLFIADGGNDRVLIFNTVPTQSGASADIVLGQIGGDVNQASDAADSMRSPMSLAWDGTNLYVSDAYNRRILVYSVGENSIPYTGVRNGASFELSATGSIAVSGTITGGDKITISVAANSTAVKADYVYTVQASDTLADVVQGITRTINNANNGAGDPNVRAAPKVDTLKVLLTAKTSGPAGNEVTIAQTLSRNATIFVTLSGTTLSGGGDAAKVAPGTLVSILAKQGSALSFGTDQFDWSRDVLPLELARTQVYFNGRRAPLLYVSPTQINAQIPWEVADTTSINAYVRSVSPQGDVVVTTPVAVTIVPANPGVFFFPGAPPQEGIVLHSSSNATGLISVDGTPAVDFVATVNIHGRTYSYTVVEGNTLTDVRNGLVAAINNGNDPEVFAEPSGTFTRIVLKARVEGPEGNGIPYGVGEEGGSSSGENLILSAFGPELCCANVPYSLVTSDNPAAPGENIILYATGVGVPDYNPETEPDLLQTGVKYPLNGRVTAPPQSAFMNALANGVTVNVLGATLVPGSVGLYEVLLNLSTGMTTDPQTQLWIAQGEFISNVITLPISSPGGH